MPVCKSSLVKPRSLPLLQPRQRMALRTWMKVSCRSCRTGRTSRRSRYSSARQSLHARVAMDFKKLTCGAISTRDVSALFTGFPEEEQFVLQPNIGALMPYSFPDDGLLRRLVDIYFIEENAIHPLVYRPTFEARLSSGLHMHDRSFGSLVLAIISIASWHCDDQRALQDSTSAGWQWYRQIQCTPTASTPPPNLHIMQTYVLCSFYATATNAQTEYAWALPGLGLRMAQMAGAHRQKHVGLPSAEDEEWKRAFWALYAMDALVSASTGCPMIMSVDDFDVQPPLAVDESFWEYPKTFEQPEGVPSSNACWTHFCALLDIVGFASRTIYAPRRSSLSLEMSLPDWDKRTVVAIDNALGEWVDDIPEHLRWNPHNANAVFFKQSVSLYAWFYFATILVHRPFITSCPDPISINWPSLALCVNAARSMCHVVDEFSRKGFGPMFYLQTMVFWAATVLSMNIWRNKGVGNDAQVRQDVGNVHICTHYLRMAEKRWPNVRHLLELIDAMLSGLDTAPLSVSSPQKRKFDDAEGEASTGSTSDGEVWKDGGLSLPNVAADLPQIALDLLRSHPDARGEGSTDPFDYTTWFGQHFSSDFAHADLNMMAAEASWSNGLIGSFQDVDGGFGEMFMTEEGFALDRDIGSGGSWNEWLNTYLQSNEQTSNL